MNQVQHVQKGILAPVPPLARYLSFAIAPGKNPAGSLRSLCKLADGDKTVVGLSQSFVRALGREVPGLEVFPQLRRSRVQRAFDIGSIVVLAARKRS
ncbi:MAG TPA: hypothetical protein VE222_03210, partial [Nitrospiraceae bacterium]|nr:hypothetical protein [Nitrospiraceae bacterium]